MQGLSSEACHVCAHRVIFGGALDSGVEQTRRQTGVLPSDNYLAELSDADRAFDWL